MKTTERTTLPDNTHERPIHEVKRSKWYKYWLSFVFVIVLWPIVGPVFSYSMNNPIKAIYFLSYFTHPIIVIYLLLCIIGVATTALHTADVYFYERYVEMRCFFPFIKRRVMYYDDMHVRVMEYGDFATMVHPFVRLSHYRTLPKFLKSPYAWFKMNISGSIYFPLQFWTPVLLEFLKIKAQSVSYYNFLGREIN